MTRAALGLLLAGCVSATNGGSTPASPAVEPARSAYYKNGEWNPVGAKALEFTAPNISGGSPMRIVPGKVNVLTWWATWSGPDKLMIRDLEAVWQRFRSQGLVMVPLSIDLPEDKSETIAEAAREWGATYDIGRDVGRAVGDKYQPPTCPTLLVIDRNGIIRFVHHGYHGEHDDIAREVESLL